jgi:hypothetical protein
MAGGEGGGNETTANKRVWTSSNTIYCLFPVSINDFKNYSRFHPVCPGTFKSVFINRAMTSLLLCLMHGPWQDGGH